jgi:hypothetical protein
MIQQPIEDGGGEQRSHPVHEALVRGRDQTDGLVPPRDQLEKATRVVAGQRADLANEPHHRVEEVAERFARE